MAHDEQLQTVALEDFRKGIASGWVSVQADAGYPDGFAQEDETFGCYGLPTGGLAPLPRITYEIDGAEPTTGFPEGYDWPTEPDYPADYADRIAVLDMHVVSPVHNLPDLETAVTDSGSDADVFTLRQWWMVNGDGEVNSTFRFKGFPAYAGDPEAAWVQKHLNTDDYLDDDLTAWNPDPSRWLYGWGSIMETRTQSAELGETDAVFNVGPPVLVLGMGTVLRYGNMDDVEGIEASGYWSWPDYSETTGDNLLAVATDGFADVTVPLGAAPPGIVFGHQGRLCSIGRIGAYNVFQLLGYHGSHNGRRAQSEIVAYWPPNAIYSEDVGWASFLEEATTGYGTYASSNANSLLLVKNKGGGVLVNGPIEAPQVVRLPGLPSVGGISNRGVVTQRAANAEGMFADQGFVYGTTSGVWMWTGSDSATELSANLNATFWVPDDVTVDRRQPGQLVGSFAFSFPYLYAPNNWVFDMRSSGWWRYHPTPDQDARDGTTFAFNDTDAAGELWAMPASYKFGTRLMAKFSQASGRDRWSWKSQPLARSRGRVLNVRAVTVVAAGRGRIHVDVYGLDAAPQRITFDNETDTMASLEGSCGVKAKDIVVKITAESYDPDDPAPTLHRIELGYSETSSIGRAT